MSSNLNFPQVSLSGIFADLAAGPLAGATVITPNRRLARALKSEFDRTQALRGAAVWDSADILPISAFIERVYDDAQYSREARRLPALLKPAQEQVLWERAINYSDTGTVLLAVAEAAGLAREAWELAHAWHLIPQLKSFPLNEDARAFRDWSQRYEDMTRRAGQIDGARLYDLIPELCGYAESRKPKRLVCYGFDTVTPQQAALLTKLQKTGCEVVTAQPHSQAQPRNLTTRRVACDDSGHEIGRAAVWARARLEANASARIGIVVPEFSKNRNKIIRTFGSVMDPGVQYSLSRRGERVLPFNTSLGMTLISYPLVSAALLVLELGSGEIEFERASLLLRSPYLSGSEAEMMNRARLDMRLRKRAESTITLTWLLDLIEHEDSGSRCPILAQGLSTFAGYIKAKFAGLHKPSALAREISEALRILGFPGERDLNSFEYQTLKKWQEVLADFAALDSVLSRIRYSEALVRLRHMAAEVTFQPETPDVPIQILGVLESAGLAFDHLWVIGLSDETWPPQPRPNPFLPVELQQAARCPHGSAAASLELAHRLTDAWLSAADEVVLSHPQHSDDREARKLSPSPLVRDIAIGANGELVLPDYPDYRNLIHDARRLERIDDAKAPALFIADGLNGSNTLGKGSIRGGVGVIKDHAACQFRSLALHRLGAESPKALSAGLDAAERGTLVHHVLAQVWSQLKTKNTLDTISDDDLEALLMRAANEAIARLRRSRPAAMSGRFAEIEQRRLARLTRDWLDEDRKRGGFEVVAIEDKRSVEIGGLVLAARLDRVDELTDGRRIIIDYKSRAPVARTLLDERPEEPQLPLYLVTSEPDAAAIAFAQVRTGDMRFVTLARDNDLLPDVPAFPGPRMGDQFRSWEELIEAWRTNIVRIAASFSRGDAKVDPKKYPHTCRNCDLRSFCRIDERAGDKFVEGDEE